MSINTVKLKLDRNFTVQLNRLAAANKELARLNGVAEEQLDYSEFIDNFIDTDVVADVSIDSSANVSTKDICTLMKEMPKPHRKILSMRKIYYEMQKEYGYKEAAKWFDANWYHKLYMHDPDTASMLPYCFAYDLTKLAEEGLFFLKRFNYEPPQHATTFMDFVKEYVSYASNRSSGACGLPNLIPYMYYFWQKDIKSGHSPKDPEYAARQEVQRFIYAVNQPYVRDSIQSAFTNVSIFDRPYAEALFGAAKFPDGTYMIDHIDGILDFQRMFMEVVSDIRHKNGFTFPVLTIALLYQNKKFVDEDTAKWTIRHNMKWADSNIFIDSSVNSLSNCCRLRSQIDTSELDGSYFNSIGGTALQVGSVKVSTINLAGLALEHKTEQEYLAALRDITELNCKALDRVRHIIRRNIEKGLLPNFQEGVMNLDKMFCTIGVIGVYETMKTFGYTKTDEYGNTYYTPEADAFGEKIFKVIHNTKDLFAVDKDYRLNLEQIPGESAAGKMLRADRVLHPDTVVDDLPLYGNQFIPLGIKTTLQERIRIASLFDSYCNGGSVCHINIDAPFTSFEQAWAMTNYIAEQGLTYFAYNVRIQTCEKNHMYYGSTCPECGGPTVGEYTRIVGFYTLTDTWSKERRAEYALREWEHNPAKVTGGNDEQ